MAERIAVVGIGESGTHAALLAHRQGLQVQAFDRRSEAELGERLAILHAHGIPVRCGAHTADDFAGATVVLSPGVDPRKVPLERAAGWTGEVGFAARYAQGRMLGITGSNGKSTTTALCGHLLRALADDVRVGGNLGTSFSALIGGGDSASTWYVLELSSYQLEGAGGLRLASGAWLNLSPDHLDRYGTVDAYAAAKARLFAMLEGAAVVNRDDAAVLEAWRASGIAGFGFGRGFGDPLGVTLQDGSVYEDASGEVLFLADEMPLPGLHNLENAMAAFGILFAAGLDARRALPALASFQGLAHRLERIGELAGMQVYNDSKGTNVDAVEKALAALPGPGWLLLGGQDKGGDFTRLLPLLQQGRWGVITFGRDGGKIAAQLEDAARLVRCGSLDEAVEQAAGRAAGTDRYLLLSPGCASFDAFANFMARGEHFKALVAQARSARAGVA